MADEGCSEHAHIDVAAEVIGDERDFSPEEKTLLHQIALASNAVRREQARTQLLKYALCVCAKGVSESCAKE